MECEKYETMFTDLHNEFTRRYEDFHKISKVLQLVSFSFTFTCVQLKLLNLQSSSILKNKFYEKTITEFYAF